MCWKFFFGYFGIPLPPWPTLDELSTNVASANNRVLFTDEVLTEGMEQDEVFPRKFCTCRDFTRRQTRAQTLTRETFLSILRVKLFMCAQFLLIKDWLFEGKANLKCSYTTCTLIVLKRSFRKDDDAFKRSNKYVFFPASERCKYYVLRALQLFKHSLVTE